jgi:hypothetical protein
LNNAGAPLIFQQASLAQNVKAYARGGNDLKTQVKIANIVAGKKRLWHDEHSENVCPRNNIKFHAKPEVCEESSTTNQQFSEPSKQPMVSATANEGTIKIEISNGPKHFSFQYVL